MAKPGRSWPLWSENTRPTRTGVRLSRHVCPTAHQRTPSESHSTSLPWRRSSWRDPSLSKRELSEPDRRAFFALVRRQPPCYHPAPDSCTGSRRTGRNTLRRWALWGE
jgi:hypothetical protein